jgi:3-oxosteroid 1-dehydrogenase
MTYRGRVTETFDLVVVGSGAGAMTAAYLAAAAGLSTVVLEKTRFIGGTSAYSGGACWLPGTQVQARAGVPDSTQSARAYLTSVIGTPDPVKVEAFLAQAPQLVADLEAKGLAFEWLPFPEYFDADGRVPSGRSIQPQSIARDELPAAAAALIRPPVERDRAGQPGRRTLSGGQALIGRLLAMFLAAGGQVRIGCRVSGFSTDNGRVTGVLGDSDGAGFEVGARHGVMLAAGGFERSQRLRDLHGVPGAAAWSMAPSGTNTGETLEAAIALGAGTAGLDQAWFCPGVLQPGGEGSFTLGVRGGMIVGADGARYANECLPYDRFGRQMATAAGAIPSWFVFDSREGGRLPAIAMPEGDPEQHLAAGTWVEADTIEELAAAMGVPADRLAASVAAFARDAQAGTDSEFSRGADEYDTFFAGGGPPGAVLAPLAQPPYRAAQIVLSDLGTKGGVLTDSSARVLTGAGEVIPGLYAVGNSAASMTGEWYPAPGVPIGTAMVFASLAVGTITAGVRS